MLFQPDAGVANQRAGLRVFRADRSSECIGGWRGGVRPCLREPRAGVRRREDRADLAVQALNDRRRCSEGDGEAAPPA